MTEDSEQTRSAIALRPGTRISFILAALMLPPAAYFYWVPVFLRKQTGEAFACGSAASPPEGPFPTSVCLGITDINLYRTFAMIAAAIIVAGLGYLFFGVDKVQKPVRQFDDDDDDDDF